MTLLQKIKHALIKRMLEKEGLQDTLWGSRILAAHKGDCFTQKERQYSLSWVTCAAAELLSDDDCPYLLEDPVLLVQGGQFAYHVANNNFYWSAVTYVAINKRVRQLKGLELWDKL